VDHPDLLPNLKSRSSNGRILWKYQHPRFYFFPGFC
jgi:hypothetical protein